MKTISQLCTLLGVSLLLFTACAGSQAAAGETPNSLTVLTYNIWNGFEGGKEEQDRFVDWMEAQDVDVAALQELVGISAADLQKVAKKWGHKYAVILKEEGYPVGLTSRFPINNVRRVMEGMHHGYLYAESGGIGFYVVHFSPGDAQKRREEAQTVIADIQRSDLPKYFFVLGDLNSYSPRDSFSYVQRYRYFPEDVRSEEIQERLESYTQAETYAPVRLLEEADLLDFAGVVKRYIGTKSTFPTEVFGPMQSYNRHRIDFILGNEALLPHLKEAGALQTNDTKYLSDHFPVRAHFEGL